MKKSLIFALCGAILAGAIPQVGVSGEILMRGRAPAKDGIFLDAPTSFRLVERLEKCGVLEEQNAEYRLLVQKDSQLMEIRIEREKILQERISFLSSQTEELLRLNRMTLDVAELKYKAEKKSWFERLIDNAAYIGVGIVAGAIVVK